MDINSFFENRKMGIKLPTLVITGNHPLSDPNRPSYAANSEIANSLFVHITRELRKDAPIFNGMWQNLVQQGNTVQSLQEPDEKMKKSIQKVRENADSNIKMIYQSISERESEAIEMNEPELIRLICVTDKEKNLSDRLADYGVSPQNKREALSILRRTSLNEASESSKSGISSKISGVEIAWSSHEGMEYRGSMQSLSQSAHEIATHINQKVDKYNGDTNKLEDKIGFVRPRDLLEGWVQSIDGTNQEKIERWTTDYAVAMATQSESVVVKSFIDLAIRYIDQKKTPSKEELRKDIDVIRENLSKPQSKLIVSMRGSEPTIEQNRKAKFAALSKARESFEKSENTSMTQAEKDAIIETALKTKAAEIMRPHNRLLVQVPALVSRRHDWKGGSEINGDVNDPENRNRALSLKKYPFIGLEGQAYYNNEPVIHQTLKKIKERKQQKPVFISHALDGTDFQKTLLKAAEGQNIPVLSAEMKLVKSRTISHNTGTLNHVDGKYGADSIKSKKLEVIVMLKNVPVNEQSKDDSGKNINRIVYKDILLDTTEARKIAAGKIVIVRSEAVKSENDRRILSIAMTNHAALKPNAMVVFSRTDKEKEGRGIDYTLAHIIHRRANSGRSAPFTLDKSGNKMSKTFVSNEAANLGATSLERNSRDLKQMLNTNIPFSDPRGTLILNASIGIEKAIQIQSHFSNLSDALKKASEITQNPKSVHKDASGLDYNQTTKFALGALLRASEDTNKFSGILQRSDEMMKASIEAGSQMITDGRLPLVKNHDAVMGIVNIGNNEKSLPDSMTKTIAILGDEKPVSDLQAQNISTLLDHMIKKSGRDTVSGHANFVIQTSFTAGTGEEIMRQGLEKKIPVVAISYIDDRAIERGSPELERFKLSMEAEKQGLGGFVTLNTYQTEISAGTTTTSAAALGSRSLSAQHAIRATTESANAVILAQSTKDNPMIMTLIGSGVSESAVPVFVMPMAEANITIYGGNNLIAKPNLTISRQISNDTISLNFRDAEISVINQKGLKTAFASIQTKAGATILADDKSFEELDKAMNPQLRSIERKKMTMVGKQENVTIARHDVMRYDTIGQIDLSKLNEEGYRDRLKLNKAEDQFVTNVALHMTILKSKGHKMDPAIIKQALSTKFKVETKNSEKQRIGIER